MVVRDLVAAFAAMTLVCRLFFRGGLRPHGADLGLEGRVLLFKNVELSLECCA